MLNRLVDFCTMVYFSNLNLQIDELCGSLNIVILQLFRKTDFSHEKVPDHWFGSSSMPISGTLRKRRLVLLHFNVDKMAIYKRIVPYENNSKSVQPYAVKRFSFRKHSLAL